MAEGILTLNPISPERDPEELGRPSYIEAPVGAGIALALDKILNQETFGPDADQIEKERKEIRESLKPGVSPEIEPPKPESFPSETLKPFKEEFPSESPKSYKESFPDQSEEINMPIITYSKDAPKDLKDLVKRSVGPEKGEKAVSKIYDDEIFNEVLEPEQLKRIMELESAFVGDLADLGDMAIPEIFENSFLAQNEDYMADYQAALESAAQKTLGNEFKTYRLMEKEDALRMLIDGQFPNVKRLQEDEEGNEFYGDVEIMGMDGEPTKLQKQAMSFTLSPKEAIQFRYRPAGGRDKLKDEDFVLIEYNASPSDIVMRGHEGEKELVLRLGETVGDKRVTPKVFKVYDAKFGEKNIELSENSQFKEFVDKSKTKEVKKARGGFILNTMPYMDKPLPGRSRDIQ
jgi:hypothetical protein